MASFSFSNPMSIASPLNPLNPLNPINPCSPLNPNNIASSSEPEKPVDQFQTRYDDFQQDLNSLTPAKQALNGDLCWDVKSPDGACLKATADGFSLHVVKANLFGPAVAVDYLFNRPKQQVEVKEERLPGTLSMPHHEHYQLDLSKHTLTQL